MTRKQILLIEDDAAITRAICSALCEQGDISSAVNGTDGIKKLKTTKFDVIITDYQMNNGNGVNVIKFCSEKKITTPIILLTAHGTKDVLVEAIKYRIFKFIEKPYNANTLRSALIESFDYNEEQYQLKNSSEVGKLSGFLVHEINNPLSVLCMTVDRMKETNKSLTQSADSNKIVNRMSNATDRIIKIVQWTKDKINHVETKLDKTKINLTSLVQCLVSDCKEKATINSVSITENYPESEVIIEADEGKLSQAIINLLNNAIEAVSTSENRWVVVSIKKTDDFVKVVITDSGTGISPDMVEKIFDPLYSTKKSTGGTGLGLSVVQSIATEHNGLVTVNSESKNTEFELFLPLM